MSEALDEKTMQGEIVLQIRTDIEAKWQLDRRKALVSDSEELIAFYKAQMYAVKADTEYKLGFIDRALFEFFKTQKHHKTDKQESYKLPNGKLVLKKQDPEYKIDDKKVIEWLKKNNGTAYIKTKEELNWIQLKKDTSVLNGQLVTVDGEFVPGIEVVERDEKFSVER